MKKLADHPTRFVEIVIEFSVFIRFIFTLIIVGSSSMALLLLVGILLKQGEINFGQITITIFQIFLITSIVFYCIWSLKFNDQNTGSKKPKFWQKIFYVGINLLFAILFATGKFDLFLFNTKENLIPYSISIICCLAFIISTIGEIHLLIDGERPTWYNIPVPDDAENYAKWKKDYDEWLKEYSIRYGKINKHKKQKRLKNERSSTEADLERAKRGGGHKG